MRRSVGLIAGLVLATAAADAGNNPFPLPELPEITVGVFLERSRGPGVLTIELRADRSVDAATVVVVQRPQTTARPGNRANCLAVFRSSFPAARANRVIPCRHSIDPGCVTKILPQSWSVVS